MGRLTLKRKYFKAFVSIIILPIIIVGIYVYRGYSNALLNNISSKSEENINTISNQIEEQSRNLQLILSTLIRDKVSVMNEDKELCELITQWNQTNEVRERYELSNIIDNELEAIFSYIIGVENIIFYLENGGFYFYKNYPQNDDVITRQEDWYKDIVSNPGISMTIDSTKNLVNENDNKTYISSAISPIDILNQNDIELIYINLKTNLLDSINNENKDEIIGKTIILDESEKIIFSNNKDEIGLNQKKIYNLDTKLIEKSGTVETKINSKKIVIHNNIVPKNNWKIVNIIDYKELMQSTNHVNQIALVLIGLIIILFIVFSLYFLKSIIMPIQNLIEKMREIKNGNLDVVVDVQSDDEIGELSNTFNTMVKDIKHLIKENEEKEKMKNEAEMEALQAQINPHFISNTLSSIRFMAIISKMKNIREMTEAFINIVSASFNRNSKFTSIEKEIEMLKSYAYIMKVRHGNKYDVEFEVDTDIKEYSILKMLVQPILENAILHGVSPLEEKGIIKVKFSIKEEKLIVEVIDNGIGMSEEILKKLLLLDCRNDKGFTSIGIKNVDKRVKLNFGQGYGISVDSVVGKYTNVKLLLPSIKDSKGDLANNVQGDDC